MYLVGLPTIILVLLTVSTKTDDQDSIGLLWNQLRTRSLNLQADHSSQNIPLNSLLESLNQGSDIIESSLQRRNNLENTRTINIINFPEPAQRSLLHYITKYSTIAQVNQYGTTTHLREIFLGRCYEYQFQRKVDQEKEYDCPLLWKIFSKAFTFKGPCDVTMSDYENFISKLNEPIPKDKGLLWSGSRELAHKYSDFWYTKRFTSLEDTMAGFLLNGLTWCGMEAEPGMNFVRCPWKCSIQEPFWAVANRQFARNLRGVVHLILNGTRQHLVDRRVYPSYMKDRYYLGPYVIPALNPQEVTKVKVIVAHTLHLDHLESCGEKSIRMLMVDIHKQGIPAECVNDPDFVKHILCIDERDSIECTEYQKKDMIVDGREANPMFDTDPKD